MTLRILATGGTFDKHYDELVGQLVFSESQIPKAITRARVTLPTQFETITMIDSLDMDDNVRDEIKVACQLATETAIVIVHGTDTMSETAHVLGKAHIPKTIILTGAMIPYEIANSDALFNLGFACGVAQTLPHGVYIAMNGQIFAWNKVKKNRAMGVFVHN